MDTVREHLAEQKKKRRFVIRSPLPYWLPDSILIGAGSALRIWQYLANRSLRVDEGALAASILPRSYGELTQSLAYGQVAPLGFLWIEKAATSLFGPSEYALRLLPLAAGLLSLFLFRSLARLILAPRPALLALALFSMNRWLVFYSSDLKQYSSDVLVSTWLVLVAIRSSRRTETRSSFPLIALGGGLAGLLSQTALFVSAGILAAALIALLWERDRASTAAVGIGALWTIAAAIFTVLSWRSVSVQYQVGLPGYWRKLGGMPPEGGALAIPRWIGQALRDCGTFLAEPRFLPSGLGKAFGVALALAATAGALWLWRLRRTDALIVTLPVLVTLASAVAQRYPFSGRLILFLFPSILVLIAASFQWFSLIESPFFRMLSAAGAIALVLLFAIRPLSLVPEHFEELRPVLGQVRLEARDADSFWVYSSAEKAFRYYGGLLGLPGNNVRYVCRAQHLWPHYVSEIARLPVAGRVWVIMEHLRDEEAIFIRKSFDVFGVQQRQIRDAGAVAYLYAMKPPDPEALEALVHSIPPTERVGAVDAGCIRRHSESLKEGYADWYVPSRAAMVSDIGR